MIGERIYVDGTNEKGWVELVDFMPHPDTEISGDLAIVNAARTSYLGESKGPERDKKLLMYLYKNKHMGPFEMVEFKFRINAPVLVFWQWVRHRTQSMNFQSGRYTPFEEDSFYTPEADAWRKQSAVNKQGSDGEFDRQTQHDLIMNWYEDDETSIMFQDLLWPIADYINEIDDNSFDITTDGLTFTDIFERYASLGFEIYEKLLNAGAAKEQARLFLPAWSSYYTAVIKVDARNLLHFLRLRLDNHAQKEIRDYAEIIYKHFVKELLPWTAEAFENDL